MLGTLGFALAWTAQGGRRHVICGGKFLIVDF
jgi:hypothetical protein